MARYLYSELASRVDAIRTLDKAYNGEDKTGWIAKHSDAIRSLIAQHMPSGSGFDNGTQIDFDSCHADRLVFTTSFHHMNDVGYYDGWTDHTITVTPSFIGGFNLRISGRNRNDIKEYIHQAFNGALRTEV